MSTNTDTFTAQQSKNRQLAGQLYDMLMRDIEPDLLSYNIPRLDEYYADETDDEHAARMERYRIAYEEFDVVLAEFMASVQDEVRTARRSSLKEREMKARSAEQEAMSSLEAAFS